ncbi:MAG TPA: DivIVA domain-containing protein [Candidatus Aphodovivens excrementavium]|nr:DivIVA domain-containing protein [Candidatus Aphodovivens excrementavium]
MAITSAEIHNQSFSIDRKGYDVDEVDVFLEHVADEIDGLNDQIAQLEAQLDGSKFDGFDTPARIVEEDERSIEPAHAASNDALAEKDARIAELEAQLDDLEAQLEEKKANDNAIAQALIIAQRSADDVVSNAKAQAADTVQDAEDEAKRIVDKAEADRQKVLDAIKKLEDDREDAREEYRALLTEFIEDANRRLNELGGSGSAQQTSSYVRSVDASAAYDDVDEVPLTGSTTAQAPINIDGSAAYSTPTTPGAAVVAAATPTPSVVEKDLSGFGDVDDDFEFEEID